MTFQSTTKEVVKTVFGLAVAAASFYAGYVFLQQTPIDRHLLYFAGAGVCFGGLLIAPEVVLDALKKGMSVIASLITALKGGGSPPAA